MKRFFLTAIFLFTLILSLPAQSADAEKESANVFKSSPDVNLNLPLVADAEEFARAALTASGCGAEETEALLEQLESLSAEIIPKLKKKAGDEENCEKILSFIYEKILSKYSLYQTLFDQAMTSGVYNCVSSALIFMYFAKRAGISLTAVETPKHAFCTVYTVYPSDSAGKKFDVETTNPYGVNPGKKRSQNLGNGAKAYITVPAKNYGGRHDVDDRRAVALIYENRIAELQRQKNDADTVQLAVDAAAIQQNSSLSLDTLSQCVVNYAVNLSRHSREREGIELVNAAVRQFGGHKRYSEYLTSTWHNLVLAKIKSSSMQSALLEVEAQKENLLPRDYLDLKEFAYTWNAQKAAADHNWKAAIEIDDAGLAALGENKNIVRQKNSYVHNYAVDFYNEAARLYNAGNKAAAHSLIRKGLEELPDNKMLLQALNQMK